jgi:hypothetical protein
MGRIKTHHSNKKDKILSASVPYVTKVGNCKKVRYLTVNLFKNGKFHSYSVHKLVAMVFIPNPMNLPQITHIDEDKHNNAVSNLEWSDGSRSRFAETFRQGYYKSKKKFMIRY